MDGVIFRVDCEMLRGKSRELSVQDEGQEVVPSSYPLCSCILFEYFAVLTSRFFRRNLLSCAHLQLMDFRLIVGNRFHRQFVTLLDETDFAQDALNRVEVVVGDAFL